MPASPDLVLVDGSSYLYRAFHALPPLTNSRGEPTGAVLGVLNMLLKFLKDYQPRAHRRRVRCAGQDLPRRSVRASTRRTGRRCRMTCARRSSRCCRSSRHRACRCCAMPGVEADDVIGTLACRAAQRRPAVLISTGDKDMAQLVNDSITLINTMSNTVLDRAGVKAKFDVFPEQIIDYLALVGDSSDNIPGIDKVGPKTGGEVAAAVSARSTMLIAHCARNQRQGGREPARRAGDTRAVAASSRPSIPIWSCRCRLEELQPGAPDVARAARAVHAL